jgi:large subunit ribosomal protein L30
MTNREITFVGMATYDGSGETVTITIPASRKLPKRDKVRFDLPQIKITLVKSVFGRLPKHRRTVRALGLTRMGSSVVHYRHETILGMVNQVGYLLKVEPYDPPAPVAPGPDAQAW